MSFEDSHLTFDEYFSNIDLHVTACPPPPQLNWLTPTESEFKIYQKAKKYYEEKLKQYNLEYNIAEKEKAARKQEFKEHFVHSLNLPMPAEWFPKIIDSLLAYCLANTDSPKRAVELGVEIANFVVVLASKH
jgi:hypothetical protein